MSLHVYEATQVLPFTKQVALLLSNSTIQRGALRLGVFRRLHK